jgi:hypothetical protein
MFRGKEAYNKTKAFKDTKFTDLAVRHVLYRLFSKYKFHISLSDSVPYRVFDFSLCTYRYFMKELLTKGANRQE